MIIFKIALTVVLILGLMSVAAIFAEIIVDTAEWVDNLAQWVISTFFCVLALFFVAGFICVCVLLISEIWT